MEKTKNNSMKIVGALAMLYLIANFLFRTISYGVAVLVWGKPLNLIISYLFYTAVALIPVILFLIFAIVYSKTKKNSWMVAISFVASCISSLIFIIEKVISDFLAPSFYTQYIYYPSGLGVAENIVYVLLNLFGLGVAAFCALDCLLRFKCVKLTRILIIAQFVLIALYIFLITMTSLIFGGWGYMNFSTLVLSSMGVLIVLTLLLPVAAYFVFFKSVAKSPKEIQNIIE